MSTHLWVLSVALGVTMLLNWSSVLRSDVIVERITKPTIMLLMIGLAWSLDGEGRVDGTPSLRVLLVALGLSLVGDVLLLNATQGRFLGGLAAFLAAHVAYVWAILETPGRGGFPWWVVPLVPALLILHARFGRDIVVGAGRQRLPVLLYQLALFALVLVAGWKGDWLVMAGAALFVVSDTVLGHDRFVLERRFAPIQTIVTYHLAQVLLVVGLLR
ncbi:MAG: lysoplasmalogenase [Terracoccus sp.]